MSATDELCALLEEHDVKYRTRDFSRDTHTTWFDMDDGRVFSYDEFGDDGTTLARVWRMTPAQAVEFALGRGGYTYEQWREIGDAIGDAMEYAHDKAIEYPDKADPLWNLDEYIERVLKAAFGNQATLGRGTCRDVSGGDPCAFLCSRCGEVYNHPENERFKFCANCGAKVVPRDH